MDTETVKLIIPILGGLLALVGGLFTFVSGRLRDAEGEDAKAVVVLRTWQWIANSLSAIGLVLSFSKIYALAVPFFAAAFVLQVYLFLQNPSPPTRRDVVLIAVFCSVFVGSLVLAVTLSLISQMIDVQKSMVEIQRKLVFGNKNSE